MAGAIVIVSAIGILLLVLVGYVLVGSTLASANIIASAQKDMAIQREANMNTVITIRDDGASNDRVIHTSTPPRQVEFAVLNTGNEIISDFSRMDIFVSADNAIMPVRYYFGDGTTANTWNITNNLIHYAHTGSTEQMHIGMLDPGEEIHVNLLVATLPTSWVTINITTENGATASAKITTFVS
jgi:flagellar protein FlaF